MKFVCKYDGKLCCRCEKKFSTYALNVSRLLGLRGFSSRPHPLEEVE